MLKKDPKTVTSGEARKTALIVAAVLTAIGAFLLYRGRTTNAWIFGGVALALVIVGLFVPPLAKLFHRVWMWIAVKLGWINSRILLTLVYFLMFVPYKLVSRIVGRDPLNLRQPVGDSYWHKREKTHQEPEQFERLF
ncbi:MAG TPA: SxtJ family membrane protein [Pyrinomonadaceae bacterium]|nr:SxtJ family membrane protein [Pyrinomonadaceae bacterium]